MIGKVLRINQNGSIQKDNPFPNSAVYTLGHRNMFGIAFDKKDNIDIVTENGNALYDEINLLEKGGNYGFPTLQPVNVNPFLSNSSIDNKPLRTYLETPGPTQALFYSGDRFPLLKDLFLFRTFNGKIYGIHLNNKTNAIDYEFHLKLNHYPFEPVVSITQSNDGRIYYGAYHLNKIDSIDKNNLKQTFFPLEFNCSKSINLDNINLIIGKSIIIELHFVDNQKHINTVSEFVKLQIPQSIIKDIENVTENKISTTTKNFQNISVPFSLNNNSTQYNNITFPIKHIEDTNIRITIYSKSL